MLASTFTFYEMFSYELATNPWMFYEFSFPAADWYEVGVKGWHGKSVNYPGMSCFYPGWFGALLETDWIRTRYYCGAK